MKRSVLMRRKKEKLKEFFDKATPDEKIDIIDKWYSSNMSDNKFNYRLLEVVKNKQKSKGLSKGDVAYINAVFSAFDINPYKFGAKDGTN